MRRWRAASILMLALAGLASAPAMPDAFRRLPAEVRDKATVVVSGRFRVTRGPCELLPDGSRRWALLRGFEPTAVYRGDVKTDFILVSEPRLLGSKDEDSGLTEGNEYLLLLRPSEASMRLLRRREGSRSHRDALTQEEVVAIVAP